MDVIDDKVSLSDCDEDYHCAVCFELYKIPCILDCHHTFCKNCCEGMSIECHQASMLFCPLCRSITPWSKMRPLQVNLETAQRVEALVTARNTQVISRSALMPKQLTSMFLQRLCQKDDPKDNPNIERLQKMTEKALKNGDVQAVINLKIEGTTDSNDTAPMKLADVFELQSPEEEGLLKPENAVCQLARKIVGENMNTENIRVVLTLKGPRLSVQNVTTELGQDLANFVGTLEQQPTRRGWLLCSLFRKCGCC